MEDEAETAQKREKYYLQVSYSISQKEDKQVR